MGEGEGEVEGMRFNAYQVGLWLSRHDIQRVIDFYKGEIAHKGYCYQGLDSLEGLVRYGRWPDSLVQEYVKSRQLVIAELAELQEKMFPKTSQI
jgi:hypothetical protein